MVADAGCRADQFDRSGKEEDEVVGHAAADGHGDVEAVGDVDEAHAQS